MHRYHINVFWSEEDGCWIADVPDLPQCSAHGGDPLEAVREVQVAMDGWIESALAHVDPLPEPRYSHRAA